VLALQSDVTQGISAHIESAVTGARKRLTCCPPRTVAPDVYEGILERPICIAQEQPGGA